MKMDPDLSPIQCLRMTSNATNILEHKICTRHINQEDASIEEEFWLNKRILFFKGQRWMGCV